MSQLRRAIALLGLVALVAASCNDSTPTETDGSSSAGPSVISEIGEGEGALSLVAWPGYTEKSWVKPFEKETGCKVSVTPGNTSDEMVNLMRQSAGTEFDGVSASGDATNRLIANEDVSAIDISMFPDYADVMDSLQEPPHNTVDGVHYGVPYMWGPNFLMWNTDVVQPAPDSWSVTWDPNSPYAGKITAYDSPIFIADAAMYLMSTQPDLGITDPYLLTDDQLNAAVDLLKQQSADVGKYWAYYLDEIKGFNSGDMVVGTAWPVNYQYIADPALGGPVALPFDRLRRQGEGRLDDPQGGGHGVGRHLDDVVPRTAPELHVAVDGVLAPPRGPDGRRRVLRRDAIEHRFLRAAGQGPRVGRRRCLPLR